MTKSKKYIPCIRLFSELYLCPKVDKEPVLAYIRWLFLEGPVGIMTKSDIKKFHETCECCKKYLPVYN